VHPPRPAPVRRRRPSAWLPPPFPVPWGPAAAQAGGSAGGVTGSPIHDFRSYLGCRTKQRLTFRRVRTSQGKKGDLPDERFQTEGRARRSCPLGLPRCPARPSGHTSSHASPSSSLQMSSRKEVPQEAPQAPRAPRAQSQGQESSLSDGSPPRVLVRAALT